MPHAAAQQPSADGADDSIDHRLADFTGYSLKRATSIVLADLAEVLKSHDLRAVSFSALSIIVEQPGLTQTQLADALQIERSNLVTILDALSQRKLIVRARVPHDRRRHALMPTAAGMDLAHAVRRDVMAHEDRLFAALTPEELADLRRILRKFRKSATP